MFKVPSPEVTPEIARAIGNAKYAGYWKELWDLEVKYRAIRNVSEFNWVCHLVIAAELFDHLKSKAPEINPGVNPND